MLCRHACAPAAYLDPRGQDATSDCTEAGNRPAEAANLAAQAWPHIKQGRGLKLSSIGSRGCCAHQRGQAAGAESSRQLLRADLRHGRVRWQGLSAN